MELVKVIETLFNSALNLLLSLLNLINFIRKHLVSFFQLDILLLDESLDLVCHLTEFVIIQDVLFLRVGEHKDLELRLAEEDFVDLLILFVELSLCLEIDCLLVVHDSVVCGGDDGNDEIEKNDKHQE